VPLCSVRIAPGDTAAPERVGDRVRIQIVRMRDAISGLGSGAPRCGNWRGPPLAVESCNESHCVRRHGPRWADIRACGSESPVEPADRRAWSRDGGSESSASNGGGSARNGCERKPSTHDTQPQPGFERNRRAAACRCRGTTERIPCRSTRASSSRTASTAAKTPTAGRSRGRHGVRAVPGARWHWMGSAPQGAVVGQSVFRASQRTGARGPS
jgi:hypothetical protein